MNWLSRQKPARSKSATPDITEQKSSPLGSGSYFAMHHNGRAVWTPRDYTALAKEGFQRNPIVYRCIRMIAEAAASAPFCVMRGSDCIPNDPAAQLLAEPHPHMSATELFEALYGYLQVSGNGYLQATLVDEVPAALFALRPDRMRVLAGKDGWAAGWEYEAGGLKKRYRRNAATGRSPIYHMRLFHPSHDNYGFSPLEAAAQSVDVHNSGGVWTKALLDNSARPSGALVYTGKERMTDEQFTRLKDELQGSHSGPRHAGRPLLLEGGLDWKPMALSPADMDFTTARREAAREIALAFGVPPMLLGIPGDNTYANFKEANQAFWRQTIIPLTRKTAKGLQGWLRPWFGEDLTLSVDLDAIPALAEAQHQLWARIGAADFLTDAEKRTLAGVTL